MAPNLKKLSPAAPAAPSPSAALAAARQADPTTPPVRAKVAVTPPIPDEAIVGLNIRVRLSTSESLAARAAERGAPMKLLVMEALQAAGVVIAPADLEDRTARNRKGKAIR
jgi:hypothetical protein